MIELRSRPGLGLLLFGEAQFKDAGDDAQGGEHELGALFVKMLGGQGTEDRVRGGSQRGSVIERGKLQLIEEADGGVIPTDGGGLAGGAQAGFVTLQAEGEAALIHSLDQHAIAEALAVVVVAEGGIAERDHAAGESGGADELAALAGKLRAFDDPGWRLGLGFGEDRLMVHRFLLQKKILNPAKI